MKFKRLKNPYIFISIVIVIIALGVALYFFYQYKELQKKINNPPLSTQEEIKELTSKVDRLIEIPKNEKPTLATVSDIEKLKAQPFFKNAQNGDKVLIFVNSQRAIIYRPSTNKIVEVGPVNLNNEPTVSVNKEYNIAIYNGTTTVGLTKTAEKNILEKIKNAKVTIKDNANSNNYKDTVVVDLTGKMKREVDELAKAVNGKVGKLPENEGEPDADLLVILGENFSSSN